ncbi:GntR family transcriptional regulator [Paralimibaculum aggregatum]|uniref:GntR family transcriptional regulator n=1 Tax=Paralimibaculum aggregatum TaxID=3036245 RepID=A0ABQ6LPI5_9RHOB|nr:GntR family transcriptional regulator [Limibaculum sp. NKW23]GMG82386.1 GntR family transcriptional regulator [Limibaculum sp. NKW23]
MLQPAPSLSDQVYDAIVDEVCNGRLAPGTHLVQERLAERFGVSRQPVQQAMSRLKADGIVEEIGRRGLFVSRLDPGRMRDHYGIRGALDGWAARTAAVRAGADRAFRQALGDDGRSLLAAGRAAAAAGDVAALVRHDLDFHFLLYGASGNALLAPTAEPHWRFLRRAMGDVHRIAEAPEAIWAQHAAILEAVLEGDGAAAERAAILHVENAARLLARVLSETETPAGEGGTA